jgi:dephospho-CoA kinase
MSIDLFKNAIALTGGISTGKSTTCNLFKLHGFLTIDADKIAHKLLDENSAKIAEMFGSQYIDKDGKVIRKELGKIIFSNEENKLKL